MLTNSGRGPFRNLLTRGKTDQHAEAEAVPNAPDAAAEQSADETDTQEIPVMSEEATLFLEVTQEEGHNAFCVSFNAGGITREGLHELLGRIESEVEAIDPLANLDIGIVETLRTRELRVTISGKDAGNSLIGLGLVLRRLKEGGFEARWPEALDLSRLS